MSKLDTGHYDDILSSHSIIVWSQLIDVPCVIVTASRQQIVNQL